MVCNRGEGLINDTAAYHQGQSRSRSIKTSSQSLMDPDLCSYSPSCSRAALAAGPHVSDRCGRGAVTSISFTHSHTAALLSWIHRCSLSTPVNIRAAVTKVLVPPSKGARLDSAAVKPQSRMCLTVLAPCDGGGSRSVGCVMTKLRPRFSRTSREVELAPRKITPLLSLTLLSEICQIKDHLFDIIKKWFLSLRPCLSPSLSHKHQLI